MFGDLTKHGGIIRRIAVPYVFTLPLALQVLVWDPRPQWYRVASTWIFAAMLTSIYGRWVGRRNGRRHAVYRPLPLIEGAVAVVTVAAIALALGFTLPFSAPWWATYGRPVLLICASVCAVALMVKASDAPAGER